VTVERELWDDAPTDVRPASMRRITLRLACEEMIGGGRRRVEHEGFDPGVPGLGVCTRPDCVEEWQVIHLRSGRLVADHLPSADAAADLARRLGCVADWTHPRGRIRQDRDRLRQVLDLLAAAAAMPVPDGQRREEA
jgi:hypothetical protein